MALDPTGAALKAEIMANLATAGIAQPAEADAVWEAVAAAIVSYLIANTEVVVVSVSGVMAGPGVSGPGTGSIT